MVLRGLYNVIPPLDLLDKNLELAVFSIGDPQGGAPNVRQNFNRIGVSIPVQVRVYKRTTTEDIFDALDVVSNITEGYIQWARQAAPVGMPDNVRQLGAADNEVFIPIEGISISTGLYVTEDKRPNRFAESVLDFVCETPLPGAVAEELDPQAPVPRYHIPLSVEQNPWVFPVKVFDGMELIGTVQEP